MRLPARASQVSLVSLLGLLCWSPRPAAAASCESLLSLSLPKATVTMAQVVPPGDFTPPARGVPGPGAAPGQGGGRGRGAAASYKDLPAFCRVGLTLVPSTDSDIKMEVWLPVTGWNGKFEASSSAGWAGSINYGTMRDTLRRGYAVTSNDSGHVGGSGTFALGHPERLVDFAWRAEHEMTVKAKAIVEAFYAAPPKFSYWEGCSTAGRMALTEAQRFPADFDGIIAGAPANFTSHQIVQQLWIGQAVHRSDASLIPPSKFGLIHGAVVEACDALDGVKDGVIENPGRCAFDPKVLACKGDDAPTCLTAAQVETARAIYSGVKNSRTGQLVFPGLEPGSELGWGQLAGQQPQAFSREMFQNVVFNDANWDYKTLNFDSDVVTAEKAYNGIMDAVDPDLKAFFGHGGKLIQYHGWSDPALAPESSINYYKSVLSAMGGAGKVSDSYRLFMVPGMAHCAGGEGTSTFDMLGSLEQWVEQRKAPAQIPASRVINGAVDRTRPLCPYPQVATYKGTGSTDEAANFACKVP
jgi:feruloyl esterase